MPDHPTTPLRFALFGSGFWARYQLAGWRELPGAECVALFNRTRSKAETLAAEIGLPAAAVYDDAEALMENEDVHFIDIVTDVGSHRRLVELAARHRKPVICQKPLAPSVADAEAMVGACAAAGVPLYVHENWRWQAPLRALGEVMRGGMLGRAFRGRLEFVTSFPVFQNQPFLADLDQFIMADVGSHVFDTARFLFGEADQLSCLTRRVNPAIRGEDVATVLMRMGEGVAVVCALSYASRTEHERFPETFAFVECELGSVELRAGGEIRVTSAAGTTVQVVKPMVYSWADPAYAVVHASIVDCHRNLLQGLLGQGTPETTAEDNLKSLRLVHAAYQSAATGQTMHF